MKPFLRRSLFISICLAVLVALFYAEEDWRGWDAWQKCKHEFEAKGFVMDWDRLIPPTVPDDQNFFAAPKMQEWFVRHNVATTTELHALATNSITTATNLNEIIAAKYLAWSDQFQPDFDLMREALKRPYTRMDGEYSEPNEQPIPNFINVRAVAQVLAQRAKCDFLLGQPDKALQELTLLHDLCRLLEAAPTGKPMTLVMAMINVAVTGLYVDAIAVGLQSRAVQEPQLAELQKQLAGLNLTPFVFDALQEEPARLCRIAEIVWIQNVTGNMKWSDQVWPRGWVYQNMVNVVVLGQKPLEGFDLAHDTVAPRKFEGASLEVEKFLRHKSPYRILAAAAIPNFIKAAQVMAHNQTMVNEAQIVCALERYRLANGSYPGSLDALVPRFVEKLPHDLIGGQPLIYRTTADGKFLLYSIGWNEKDDSGQESPPLGANVDFTKGDWVWQTGRSF